MSAAAEATAVVEMERYTEKGDQVVDILHDQVSDNVCLRIAKERFAAGRRETPTYSKLLGISNVYGYMVAGTPSGLSVFRTVDAQNTVAKGKSQGTNTAVELDARKEIDLSRYGRVTHVGVSADELNVVVATLGGKLLVYSAAALLQQGGGEPLSTVDVGQEIRDVRPNPKELPKSVAVLTVAGDVFMADMEAGTSTRIVSADSTRVTAICWSLKGKQLVCGDDMGMLTQRTPGDGAVKRTIEAQAEDGNIPEGAAVLAVYWIETHTFFAVYGELPDGAFDSGCGGGGTAEKDEEFEDNATAGYIITRSNKTAPFEWYYIEDPCSSLICPGRYPGFHIVTVPNWGESAQDIVIMAGTGSDATMTIGTAATAVVGDGSLDPESYDWVQWDIDGRMAVMPLSALTADEDSADTFPVGMAVDFTSHRDLPPVVEDGDRVKPVPLLWILNTDGCLLGYNVLNTYEMERGGRSADMVEKVAELPASAGPGAAAPSKPAPFAAGTTGLKSSGFGASAKADSEASKTAGTSAFGGFGKPAKLGGFGSSSGFGGSSFGKAASITPIVKAPSAAMNSGGFGSGTKFGAASTATSFGGLSAMSAAASGDSGGKSIFDEPAKGASIFDAPAKGPSIFDSSAKGSSIFDAPAKSRPSFGSGKPFGSSSKPAAASKEPGTKAGANAPTPVAFGSAAGFGSSKPAASAATSSSFGALSAGSAGGFGSAAKTTSTPFGGLLLGTSSGGFGSSKPATTSSATSAFGALSTGTASGGFGGLKPPATTTAPTTTSSFAAVSTGASASGFGTSKPATPSTTASSGKFGSSKSATTASTKSVFGALSTGASAGGFGSAKPQPTATAASPTPSASAGLGDTAATEDSQEDDQRVAQEQEKQKQAALERELAEKTQALIDQQYISTCNTFDGEIKALAASVQKTEEAIARMRAVRLPPIAVDPAVQSMASLTSRMQDMGIDDTELWNRTADVLVEALGVSKDELRASQRELARQTSAFLKTETKREEISRILGMAQATTSRGGSADSGLSPLQRDYQRRLKAAFTVISKRSVDVEQVVNAEADRLEGERHELRAPTVDSIQRTLHNVDNTLRQKNSELDSLAALVDSMDISQPSDQLPKRPRRPSVLRGTHTPVADQASEHFAASTPRTAASGVPWSPKELPFSTAQPAGRRSGYGLRDEDLLVSGRPAKTPTTGFSSTNPQFPYTQVRELVPRTAKSHRRASLVIDNEPNEPGLDSASVAQSVFSAAAAHLNTRRQRAVVRDVLTRPNRIPSVVCSPKSSTIRTFSPGQQPISSQPIPMPNLDRYVQAFGKLKINDPPAAPAPDSPRSPKATAAMPLMPSPPRPQQQQKQKPQSAEWTCEVC
ncbi:hypothetical protein GGF46_002860, partial [Coemansia sp. RSA 552]